MGGEFKERDFGSFARTHNRSIVSQYPAYKLSQKEQMSTDLELVKSKSTPKMATNLPSRNINKTDSLKRL